jgi:hypothetical protein
MKRAYFSVSSFEDVTFCFFHLLVGTLVISGDDGQEEVGEGEWAAHFEREWGME